MAELALPDMGPVVLGGRIFRVAQETTARQDDWVLCATADAGLERLDVPEGADQAEAVTLAAFRSGCADRILAGVLVEEGATWSAESAERNAQTFGALTNDLDKATRRRVLVAALARFFWPALVSLPSSPKSSEIPGGNQNTGEASADSPVTDPAGTSASGATSSAPSADTILS